MKLNITFSATGCQKLIEADNACKLGVFSEKCTATEVAADALEDDVCQYAVRKPLNKEGEKSRTKALKIHYLVPPRVLQHRCQHIALKKQCIKKNKEEAAEYAKLLAKRMKEAKEKHQEQIAKRCRLCSLRASTSQSESSQNKIF
ncbi:hypothetical protein P7K49_020822 [Saguinus oedipus]|uniref:Small ribosomal subunit protein eS6 n=1 Tax=Saguinus oedipus TaxID=9490 RepID=A0ABQ9URN6_SAGOE|nr:hypothetical protein P7K49_020822 [Saguinus oedipus]